MEDVVVSVVRIQRRGQGDGITRLVVKHWVVRDSQNSKQPHLFSYHTNALQSMSKQRAQL